MAEIIERTRLNTQQRMMVLAMLSRGDTQDEIIREIDARFGIPISGVLITQIKRRHPDVLDTMRSEIIKAENHDAQELLIEARKQISVKLRKSRQHESKIEDLNKQYRNGEIEKLEYERKRSGYLTLRLGELADLSKKLYEQTKVGPGGGDAPGAGGGDLAMVENITRAIKDGNTIELQRIIFNVESNAPES